MRQQVVVTLSSDLDTSETITLPHRVDPFWFADADHVAIYGSVRYTSPTDFTLACNGEGTVTLTWLNATTIPSGAQLNVGVARVDMITTASGASGGGGGGAVTASDGALVTLGSKADAAAVADNSTASVIAFLKRLAEQHTATNAALTDSSPVGVFDDGNSYSAVAASATDSAVGDANDTIAGVILFPSDTAPAGNVVLKDGTTTIATITAGTLTEATPRFVPLFNIRMTTGFKITTPSDVTAIVAYRART